MAVTDLTDDLAPSDPQLSLSERLALSRKRAGYDQQQMAERLHVSRPLVSKWERGRSIPNVMQAARWAEVTSTSFGWLAGVPIRSRWCASLPAVPGQMTLALGVERPQLTAV